MGTSYQFDKYLDIQRDHPHAYGDKLSLCLGVSLLSGSSPRVWGQVLFLQYHQVLIGIIPTRMGTSIKMKAGLQMAKDHPHAYGDKNVFSLYSSNIVGSSPRVWGQEHRESKSGRTFRIIPTRMGTRCLIDLKKRLNKDHPHAYGDKRNTAIVFTLN